MNDEQKLEALQQIMAGLNVSALGAAKKDEAEEAGRESKEVKAEPETQPAEAAPEQGGVGLTPELIGQALAMAIQPVLDRLDALEQKAQVEPEPVDDFAILMGAYKSNVIGQPDARVDGRTKEARDAPVERPSDGFPARKKVNSDGFAALSINRIFDNTLAKELAEMRGGQ